MKGKSYKMTYYYAQKSLVVTKIKAASKKYKSDHYNY